MSVQVGDIIQTVLFPPGHRARVMRVDEKSVHIQHTADCPNCTGLRPDPSEQDIKHVYVRMYWTVKEAPKLTFWEHLLDEPAF